MLLFGRNLTLHWPERLHNKTSKKLVARRGTISGDSEEGSTAHDGKRNPRVHFEEAEGIGRF
jgi:hypothetical protein